MSYFKLIKTSGKSKARAGVIQTGRNEIMTPVFMPVGTQATVKAVQQRELKELNSQIILGNTYHLYLRPGDDLINSLGGLHKFMNWDRSILTDSGGYQIFSLQELRTLSRDGAEFKSHIDGSKHYFTPESVVDIQRNLGSDIIMVLDECAPYPAEKEYVINSMRISAEWANRSRKRFLNTEEKYGFKQYQYGIAQGGMYNDLRVEYLKEMVDIGFEGNAIGGLSVGEPAELMYELTDLSTGILPEEKPRYLMGVGTPQNILECIELGIDQFDCVMPTRNARNGQIFTTRGKVNIKNAKHRLSDEKIDEGLDIYPSNTFTKAYLHHLIKSNEILGLQLASLQNISFYLWLTNTAREKILSDEFEKWKSDFLNNYNSEDT